MSQLIAITGKGGVGKTTLSGLLISRLVAAGRQPVLAVDADPNSCLDSVLGVKVVKTVGGVREEARQIAGAGQVTGIAKQELLQMKIGESLVEAQDFDLIAMGRPEGAGCYCYANNVLKEALGEISHHYPYVVLDNEAGLENLSRRIVQKVNILILVADPSRNGLETLKRLYDLAREMDIKFDKLALVINRLRDGQVPARAVEIQKETGADFLVGLPNDAELAEYGEQGRQLQSLPATNPVAAKVDAFLNAALA